MDKKKKRNPRDININGLLLRNRNIFLYDEINYNSSQQIIRELMGLDLHKKADIHMFIHSPGGYVTCGLAIIDTMRALRSNVITIVNSYAASMAGTISVCGDERRITKHGTWMGHEIFCGGADYLSKIAPRIEHIKSEEERLINILKEKTKLTKDDLKKWKHSELWLYPEDCIKKGIVDSII